MQDFFFNGIWRMDWGLGNPNKTAALIATLMVAVWVIAYIWRRGFWLSLVLFSGLAVCMVHTFSRGGLIAAFAGLIPLLIYAPRPWPWKRIAAILASVWLAIGFSVYIQAHERYTKGIAEQDRSISNRLKLWSAAPAMMKDAPGGWGLGKSGQAYMDWYQPLDQHESYRTLVNSHLTWLVEFGWAGRFLYLFGWISVFMICWPNRRVHWLSVPFGISVAFAVAGTFSSVAESLWLWGIPIISLFPVFIYRYRRRSWPALPFLVALPGLAAVIVLTAYLSFSTSDVRREREAVIVGKGTPSLWVVVDREILGMQYARALRGALLDSGPMTIGIVESTEALPKEGIERVVLSGHFMIGDQIGNALNNATDIVLINPRIYPQELSLSDAITSKLTVFLGEFSQSPAAASWAQTGKSRSLPGVGDFLPDWLNQLLRIDEPTEPTNSLMNTL